MNAWKKRGLCRASFPNCEPGGISWRGDHAGLLTLAGRARLNGLVSTHRAIVYAAWKLRRGLTRTQVRGVWL